MAFVQPLSPASRSAPGWNASYPYPTHAFSVGTDARHAHACNRGGAEGALRTQMFHACIDGFEAVIAAAARSKSAMHSGPKWPANLILGEADRSQVLNPRGKHGRRRGRTKPKTRNQSHR